MATERIGRGAPIGAYSYSSNLDAGVSGSFVELWRSDAPEEAVGLGTIFARTQAILNALETTYFIVIGSTATFEPFEKSVVVGIDIRPIEDDDDYLYAVTISLEGKKRATTEWVFSFSSSLSTAETNIDINGGLITVGTVVGTPLVPAVPTATTVPKTIAQVQKMYPSVRITASGNVLANPFLSYHDLIGDLNSTTLTITNPTAGGSAVVLPIGTTMLVSANVSTPSDGLYYTVDYEFEFRKNPLDWEAVVVAIDPKTGKPYEGIINTTYSDGTVKGAAGGVVDGSKGYALYEKSNLQALFT